MKKNTEKTNIETLKGILPDIVKEFEAMDRDALLEACCGETLDAINMQDRVQLFMNECTNGFSKTNYDIDVLKKLILQRKEADIDTFCAMFLEDGDADEDIIKVIKERGNRSLNQ